MSRARGYMAMLDSRRRTPPGVRDALETLVGRDTTVRGNLEFRGSAIVEGRIAGHVLGRGGVEDLLILTRHGVVEGDIRVGTQTLDGQVIGDVYACALVQLGTQAHVSGNVYYARLEIAAGAEVNGSLVHRPDLALATDASTAVVSGQLLATPVQSGDPDGL